MSPAERAQAILGDPSLVALKEWEGLNGVMGVYHSKDHGYFSLLILIQSQNEHYRQFYPDSQRDQALHDAELIAAAFGAQERLP
jgi:hypothetical protein